MGRFVNPDNSAFQVALNSKIYVDKTGLIEYTNSVLDTTDAYICIVDRAGSESLMQLICLRLIIAKVQIQRKCSLVWKSAKM